MTNYAKTNIGNEGRVELHETLSLTGAEISINTRPAGANVPFSYILIKQTKKFTVSFLAREKLLLTERKLLSLLVIGSEFLLPQSVSSLPLRMLEFHLSVFRLRKTLWKNLQQMMQQYINLISSLFYFVKIYFQQNLVQISLVYPFLLQL